MEGQGGGGSGAAASGQRAAGAASKPVAARAPSATTGKASAFGRLQYDDGAEEAQPSATADESSGPEAAAEPSAEVDPGASPTTQATIEDEEDEEEEDADAHRPALAEPPGGGAGLAGDGGGSAANVLADALSEAGPDAADLDPPPSAALTPADVEPPPGEAERAVEKPRTTSGVLTSSPSRQELTPSGLAMGALPSAILMSEADYDTDAKQEDPFDLFGALASAIGGLPSLLAELVQVGSPAEDDGLLGDLIWRPEDGCTECVLRLRTGGKWWHAAHRTVGNSGLTDESGASSSQRSWEIAECVGTWREVTLSPVPVGMGTRGIMLTCENFRWAERAPVEEGGFRPDAVRRAALDEAASNGQLSLLYGIHPFWDAGARVLELQESASCDELRCVADDIRAAALQSLGFAAKYGPVPSSVAEAPAGTPTC